MKSMRHASNNAAEHRHERPTHRFLAHAAFSVRLDASDQLLNRWSLKRHLIRP